jgi:hypothetical protein
MAKAVRRRPSLGVSASGRLPARRPDVPTPSAEPASLYPDEVGGPPIRGAHDGEYAVSDAPQSPNGHGNGNGSSNYPGAVAGVSSGSSTESEAHSSLGRSAVVRARRRPTGTAPTIDHDVAGHGGTSVDPEPLSRGDGPTFAPAYVSPGRSAVLHWRLVVVWAVIGLVAGSGYGIARHPVYGAQANLYVGKTLSLANTAAIPGLALAATQIAGDYSRFISDPATLADAAKRMDVATIPGGLTASQIAESPEIVVYATAATQATAVKLAAAGSAALVDAVATVNATASKQLSQLKDQYTQVQQALNTATQSQDQQNAELSALQSSPSATSAAVQAQIATIRGKLATLATQISTDQLTSTALNNQYQNNYSPLQSDEQTIQSLGSAGATGSDRHKRLELAALVGTVAGFLFGVTLASSLDLWGDRLRRNGQRTGP